MSKNYEGEDEKHRTAVCLIAKTDYNSAVDGVRQTLRSIFRQHKTFIYEVGSKAEFYSSVRELGEECLKRSEKINLVVFDGHGDETVIQFGFPYTHSKTELSKKSAGFMSPLRRYIKDDGQLVLCSCESARGGEDKDGIAYEFAKAWKGIEVYGSSAEQTGTRDIVFSKDGRVKDVDYTVTNSLRVIKL
jgi:hypothetical protein